MIKLKFFRKSKEQLIVLKNNFPSLFKEFGTLQSEYFQLLVKKDKTLEEKAIFKKLQVENFKFTILIACFCVPIPLIATSYFIFMPRKWWPQTLSNLLIKKESPLSDSNVMQKEVLA